MANALRTLLADLIGAEVQAHPVTVAGKTKLLHFRQFDDATGRSIFAMQDGESADDRGLRIMRAVVAASLCDETGATVATLDDVKDLPMVALEPLYQPAARTNNIAAPAATEADTEAGTGGDNADPADEALSPNG